MQSLSSKQRKMKETLISTLWNEKKVYFYNRNQDKKF